MGIQAGIPIGAGIRQAVADGHRQGLYIGQAQAVWLAQSDASQLYNSTGTGTQSALEGRSVYLLKDATQ